MPRYRFEAPDGTRFALEGDTEPTETEVEEAFNVAARSRIEREVNERTAAAEPSDTASKASASFAASALRAFADPIKAGASLYRNAGPTLEPLLRYTPGASTARGLSAAVDAAGITDAAAMAEGVAKDTKGNELVSDVAGAVGSGVGSMPFAMVPGVGQVTSATAAGLGSYESTRREALKVFLQTGLDPAEAEASAHRVALKAGVITGGVTGAFNRWGPSFGLGRGVERGLARDEFTKITVEELRKSALRPVVKGVLKEYLGEATEEATDQAFQAAFVETELNPDLTFLEAVKSVAKAGALGGVAGAAIGGPVAAVQVISDRRRAGQEISRGGPDTATPPRLSPDDVKPGPITGTQEALQRAGTESAPNTQAGTEVSPETATERGPGVYVDFKTPDGKVGHLEDVPGASLEDRIDYVKRTIPGAVIERAEVIEAPNQEPPQAAETPPGPGPEPDQPAGFAEPMPEPEPLPVAPAEPPPKTAQDPILVDDLSIGDEFTLEGERVTVDGIDLDENGAIDSVRLKDGRKFGTQIVPAGTMLKVDSGTVVQPEPEPSQVTTAQTVDEPFSINRGPSKPGLGVDRAKALLQRIGITSPRVTISTERRTTADGKEVEGVLEPSGRIVIFAEHIADEDDLRRVIRHEALHDVYADPAVQSAWNRLRATYDAGKRAQEVRGEGYTSNVDEEGALDEVESRVDKKAPLFTRFVNAIVRAMYARRMQDAAVAVFGLDRMADTDARALVGYAMRLDARSRRTTPKDQGERQSLAIDPEERNRQKMAGRAMTPTQAVIARDAVEARERIGWGKPFTKLADALVAKHGEDVRPWIPRAWEHSQGVREAIASGVPPAAIEDLNRIMHQAQQSPSLADRQPVPVYDPEKVRKWWNVLARQSDVVRYFGGDDLLRRRQVLDMRTAYQSAAVQAQSEALREQLEASFWGPKAKAIPRFLRPFFPKAKLRRFMRFALPIASHLNVTGGTSGAWQFADFQQRAGFMPESEANKQGISSGDQIWRANPVDGSMETLTLGAKIELDSGAKGYQVLRPLDASRQAAVYAWATQQFPEFQWFLDLWLDPSKKDTRVTVNGVEIPVFNRASLAGRYAEGDPKFAGRESYTPDVSMGSGLIGAIRQFRKERRVNFAQGTVSPGRKYETGTAREMGNTLDLLSGFNVRAMQVLQESVRKEWMQDVLGAAADLPPEGLPEGWAPIENAMADVWRAVQTLRKFDDPLNFPQTTERLRDDDSPAYKAFFGEVMRLKNADKPKMIPQPLVDALVTQYAATKEFGIVGHIARIWARNWKAFLLLMPDTFVENRTDNYLRFLMQAHRQLVLSALRGGDRLAFREARKLAWSAIVNMVPGVRQISGANSNALFDRFVRERLPAELFDGGTRLQDLWIEKGTADEEVASALEMGRRGKAAAVIARDLGPLILEKTGYGNMDVKAKQQFAFTTLLARAEHQAQLQGLTGEAAAKFAEAWLMQVPEDQIRRAIAGANRLLLNYGDTPGWLARLARNPISNTFIAFPLFRYHFLGREIDRATAAFRALHKMAVRKKKLTREEWAASLADTISYVTLPLMGYAAAEIAGALRDSLVSGIDDPEDEDPRAVVGATSVYVTDDNGDRKRKPLPRELVTANRINVSKLLRDAGVPLDGEKDYWWHIKDYPLIRSTALMHLAVEDAKREGVGAGVTTLFAGLRDMLTSLAGTGQAVKIPAKIAATLEAEESGRPGFTALDPYATAVPLDAYITLQALNLIPGQRQANEVLKWLDPVPRRITASKSLDYDPGVQEALQAEGWTGLADRVARGVSSGDFSSPLPPQGRINRRFGFVEEPRQFDLASRIAAAMGQNVKPIPRTEYEEAIRP